MPTEVLLSSNKAATCLHHNDYLEVYEDNGTATTYRDFRDHPV